MLVHGYSPGLMVQCLQASPHGKVSALRSVFIARSGEARAKGHFELTASLNHGFSVTDPNARNEYSKDYTLMDSSFDKQELY
jgi:hypothetical protein